MKNDGGNESCVKLDGVNVQVLDGMVLLVDPRDPENRFIYTREQAGQLGALLKDEAPRLALMLRAATKSARDLSASARRGSQMDEA